MLGHISSTPGSLLLQYAVSIFGGNDPNNYPNIMSLMYGLLPDVTFRVGQIERQRHSSRLMQTAFHELAHASHFRVAGQSWWISDITAILTPAGGNTCGGYGCGTNDHDGKIAVSESWADFLGTAHAIRIHPNGITFDARLQTSRVHSASLEQQEYFFHTWIPKGIYHDLMDVVNTQPEGFDNFGGLTIQQMYNVLGPNVDDMCEYEVGLFNLYPTLDFNGVNDIFEWHSVACY